MCDHHHVYSSRDLIVVDAAGRLDRNATEAMIKSLTSHPDYDKLKGVIADLRHVQCDLSVTQVYELASLMAQPDAGLRSTRKIAVVIDESKPFDHAAFFETCAQNRGLPLRSFADIKHAEDWLNEETT